MRVRNGDTAKRPAGMLGFTLVWSGQILSPYWRRARWRSA